MHGTHGMYGVAATRGDGPESARAPGGAARVGPRDDDGAAAGRTRRSLLRALFVSGAAVAAGAAGGGALAAPRPPVGTLPRRKPAYDVLFDEVYRGRRIEGRRLNAAESAALDPAGTEPSGRERVEVKVDGRPLHLMRRADGSYLSMVDHYRSWPTPLDATRAAVDALGSARLAPASA